ncbi:MAG: putative spermidine/putrescine transport system substrate-binding protein [Microbacteriaceae bacterium]|nr:putative spermidine/putrescine transport system substrate-binding protein [Microbacteriaceae bacterium]
MFVRRARTAGIAALVAIAALSLSACAGGATASTSTAGAVDAKTATSAQALGGLDALVKAAKAEGQLNVIALPDNWANYGAIKKAFTKKYGITINSASPDISSAEEITAAKNLKGQNTAPDVFDVGTAVALTSTSYFAPYKVANWSEIPAGNKASNGLYVNDYTGSMSIGYNSKAVPKPTSLNDLLSSKYKGAVALNGDPTQANAAFSAVGWVSMQSGGSLDNFQPGIDFFKKLNAAGNFITVGATPQTIASGETKVVFDWSYNNLAAAAATPGWKVTTLPGTAYTSFYNQAVSADAPHPAAARLWEEFLYSPEAQNLFLSGGAYPVTLAAMTKAGTIDKTALSAIGTIGKQATVTDAQAKAANTLLAANWAAAVN